MMQTYKIYRRQLNDKSITQWIATSHILMARSDKEAQAKVKRKFNGAGFHNMQLVAFPMSK